MEGTLVGGLIAEYLIVDLVLGELLFQKPQRALGKPVMLGHFFDQDVLGGSGGLVLLGEGGEQRFIFRFVFGSENDEASRETVVKIILRDGGFAGFGFRTGGVLGVGAIRQLLCRSCHRKGPFWWAGSPRKLDSKRKSPRA